VILEAPLPHDAPFQPLPHHEIFRDPGRMLYNELVHGFRTSIAMRDRWPDDLPLTVRANFGTVLIASMFGARVEQIGENPPWIRHEEPPSLQDIAGRDPLDFSQGWVPRAIETMEAYHDILRRWPELYEMIHIVLPDLQGPLDNLGLVRGSTMFLDLAANPDEADAALTTMATAQIGLARDLAQVVRDGPPGYSHQHGLMIRGNILLRNDSLVMVSPAMYRNQLARHDERVLSELGGGGLHSCGKIDHLAAELLRLPSVKCLDLGQPHLNDIDAVYAEARAVGKPLIRLALDDADLEGERLVERFPTGPTSSTARPTRTRSPVSSHGVGGPMAIRRANDRPTGITVEAGPAHTRDVGMAHQPRHAVSARDGSHHENGDWLPDVVPVAGL
jgi:hypothetical protein